MSSPGKHWSVNLLENVPIYTGRIPLQKVSRKRIRDIANGATTMVSGGCDEDALEFLQRYKIQKTGSDYDIVVR